jgi:hypothetical protein
VCARARVRACKRERVREISNLLMKTSQGKNLNTMVESVMMHGMKYDENVSLQAF